ncbi:MAG: sulfatase-like hydrolase/transferase, partial [Saprospiraceae bacterium]|nr:sulfatase-like hydrolase/transferase [Saprospiraceae bacterium]
MRAVGCIVLLLLLVHNASAQESKPNVIIIICDDLNDAVEGMGGHPQAKTPAIDKLMEKGVQFTNAHCNAPLCGPSRASIWSGLYPHTTGIYGNGQHWRTNPVMKNTITAMEHFKANGYEVLGSGEVHHNGHEDWSIFSSFGPKPSMGPFPWDGITINANGHKPNMSRPDMPEAMQGGRISWEDSFGPISDIPEYKPDTTKGIPGYRGWILYDESYRYISDND